MEKDIKNTVGLSLVPVKLIAGIMYDRNEIDFKTIQEKLQENEELRRILWETGKKLSEELGTVLLIVPAFLACDEKEAEEVKSFIKTFGESLVNTKEKTNG